MPDNTPTPMRRTRERPPSDDDARLQELLDARPPNGDIRPGILVEADNELEVLRQAIDYARDLTPALYRRGGRLARVEQGERKAGEERTTTVPVVVEVTADWLQPRLQQVMFFQKRNKKMQGYNITTGVPASLAKLILASSDDWPYPILQGVISTPTMRPDGTLLTEEGYDVATGLYLTGAPPMPRVTDRPTKEDAQVALARLDADLLCGFPFEDEASRSVALSALMTPVLRGAFPHAPLHAISAPTAGTGKSHFIDMVGRVAVGNYIPAIDYAEKREGEFDKTLAASLMAGVALINIDNVEAALGGGFLCQAVSEDVVQPRILGMSKTVDVPTTSVTFFANGNNLAIKGDLARRVIRMEMNANLEKPWDRPFDADPVENARKNRGQYLADILTIGRAYVVAGNPDKRTLNGFDGWSRVVRSALVWLGCADPCDTTTTVAAEDPLAQQRVALFTAIKAVKQYEEFQVKDLSKGFQNEALDAALLAVAGGKSGVVDNGRLAWWFRRNKNVVAAKLQLVEAGKADGSLKWKLRAIAADGQSGDMAREGA